MTTTILFTQEENLGVVTLNRLNAMNALSLSMIKSLQQQLIQWEADETIHAVIIRSHSNQAFCAGGDVRWLYEMGLEKNPELDDFFWHEYRLNHYIHHYKKPYIALMNGMTMGGGVGISLHGSHPVATENFSFAMPETGIGFFPDIGSSYLLSRCANSIGTYLGLTGKRLNGYEASALGLITYCIDSSKIDDVFFTLKQTDLSKNSHQRVEDCLQQFRVVQKEQAFDHSQTIKQCFSEKTIEGILANLKERGDDWSIAISQNLLQKSPLSLKVTLEQLTRANCLSLAECLTMDYCIVYYFMQGGDFYEGVRALLIDKDKLPRWRPCDLSAVTPEQVARVFKKEDANRELILFPSNHSTIRAVPL